VVEDSSTNRILLVQLLKDLGFAVREAQDGQEAIAVWKSWRPHLIWMDIQMPVMNGYEATQQIKTTASEQETIVIALTASAFEEQRRTALLAGCDDFVRKPFRKEDLLMKLSQYLGVQFVYENSSISGSSATYSLAEQNWSPAYRISMQARETHQTLAATALRTMPIEWIQQLKYAASQCSDLLIQELMQQIPEEKAALTIVLNDLSDSFRFDQIASLAQSCLDEAS
jgi:CheY-like chemotaxis protein